MMEHQLTRHGMVVQHGIENTFGPIHDLAWTVLLIQTAIKQPIYII